MIFGLCVGAAASTSGFEASDPDFRIQLVELYKMYYTFLQDVNPFFDDNQIDISFYEKVLNFLSERFELRFMKQKFPIKTTS